MYISPELHRDDRFMSPAPQTLPRRWPLAAGIAAGFFAGLIVYGVVAAQPLSLTASLPVLGLELMAP